MSVISCLEVVTGDGDVEVEKGRGVKAQRVLVEQAAVGVIVRWWRRDVDTAFEGHPAVMAPEHGMSHGPAGDKEGPDSDLGSGYVAPQ